MVTFYKFIALNDAVIKNSIMLIDEFHSFMNGRDPIDKLKLAQKVHAVTATIGEDVGHERCMKRFEQANV